jgi:AraC-like DNA-binding protein
MLQLTFEEFERLLTQNITKAEEAEGLYHSSYISSIDTPFCIGNATNISIREGVTLLKAQLTFMQDTTIEMRTLQAQIGFAYCLKGQLKGYRTNTIPKENSELYYQLTPRTGHIYATAASHGWMQLEKGKLFQILYLLFSYENFEQLVGEQLKSMPPEFIQALKDSNGYYLIELKLSSKAVALAEAIFDNPYSGKSREFYREAKVIELLAYQVDALTKSAKEMDSTGVKLTTKEEQQIEYAHQVLLSSLANPPSLIELAKELGMSDYRLKNGFRQKYGLSPYRFVVDNRMIKAKALLEKGNMSVSAVAYAVGFSSLGSFSNTFYEKYGIRPSEVNE